MADTSKTDQAAQRLAVALKLHEIAGMVPTTEQLAMFEMFEREGLTIDEQLAYVTALHINTDC